MTILTPNHSVKTHLKPSAKQRLVTQLRRECTRYFYSGWKPGIVCFGLLGLLSMVQAIDGLAILHGNKQAIALGLCAGGLCAIAFIGLISATSWNVMKRRWLQSIVSLVWIVCFCYTVNMTLANQFLFAAETDLTDATAFQSVATEVIPTTHPQPPLAKTSGFRVYGHQARNHAIATN